MRDGIQLCRHNHRISLSILFVDSRHASWLNLVDQAPLQGVRKRAGGKVICEYEYDYDSEGTSHIKRDSILLAYHLSTGPDCHCRAGQVSHVLPEQKTTFHHIVSLCGPIKVEISTLLLTAFPWLVELEDNRFVSVTNHIQSEFVLSTLS